MRTWRLTVLAGALVLALGARPSVGSAAVCPSAPRPLAQELRHELRVDPHRLFAVRSRARFTAPAVRAGVYFVSGDIGAAVATWAVNARAWRTGRGLIVAVDERARAVSPHRWRVSPRRYGISRRADGYARSRNCANPTRR